MEINKNCTVVLGGYVNGYNIIRELYENKVQNIVLFDYGITLASKSNKISCFKKIKKGSEDLKNNLLDLNKKYKYLIIFPTNDQHLQNLYDIYNDIKDFCFIPFNKKTIKKALNKHWQYSFCEKYNIPYPKTKFLKNIGDLEELNKLMFPLIIKPNKYYANAKVFRVLYLKDAKALIKNKEYLKSYLRNGIEFLASEYIPGDDTNICSFIAYRSQKGKIINEWIGKKLSQYPNNFGMFGSATNQAPHIIVEQGRLLLDSMDLKGICEPEFKYDRRDGKYKLMEITLRSTMWHRLGYLSGVNINYTQYLDAIGESPVKEKQNLQKIITLIYMKHEILNLLNRKGYWKHFKKNIIFSKNKHFTIYDNKDLKPFLFDLSELILEVISKIKFLAKG